MEAIKWKVNQSINWTVDEAGGKLIAHVRGVDRPLTFSLDKVSAANRAYAALHGFKQRLADAAALGRDGETGASASPEEKAANIQALIDHYESGAEGWNITRTGGGGKSSGLLVRALMELSGESAEAVKAKVEAWTPKERAAVETSAKVKPVIDRMKAAGVEGVDAESLLADLGL